jgi:alpha,alpha-trehalase
MSQNTPPQDLPSALTDPGLADRLAQTAPAVFLDYDGVLSPIVERPEDATLAPETKQALVRLAGRCPVAIVSGRDLADVRGMVDVDGLVYAGSHGWDIEGLDVEADPRGEAYLPALAVAEREATERLADVPGARVERKRYAIAVHYRQVDDAAVDGLEAVVRDVAAGHPELRVTGGKRIFELRPDLEWNKGTAVTWLLEQLGLDRPDVVPIYIGDDETDEDAFRALAGRGIGVIVGPEVPSAASYRLDDVDQAREFLELLADMCEGSRST